MSSDIEILHDFLKNPISLDLEKLKYGRGSASLTTDSGREIKLPIFDANEIFQKVNFFKNQKNGLSMCHSFNNMLWRSRIPLFVYDLHISVAFDHTQILQGWHEF